MKPLCVYCLEREGTTLDHVPPKVLFPSPRPNLITVPACTACNNHFSKDDEEFASKLSLRVGMDSPATLKLHEKNRRIVQHNRRLRREIIENTIPMGSHNLFQWTGGGHDKMVQRIIRGLFYHKFGRPVPAGIPVRGAFSKPFGANPEIMAMWSTWPGENIGTAGEFRFRYMPVIESPDISLWMMTFYDRHFAHGQTGTLPNGTSAV